MADELKDRLRKRKEPALEAEESTSLCAKRPAKSNAQRAKEHYARLKDSRPEAYSAKLANQKAINERRKNYMKMEASEEEKNQAKEKHRERMREWRKKKAMEVESESSNFGVDKRKTRKDAEKEEERKKKDRERKQRERAQWSKQKHTAEKKKNRDRYYAKKTQSSKNVCNSEEQEEEQARTLNARRQAVFRVNQALPKNLNMRQQTLDDLLTRQPTTKQGTTTSTTAAILKSNLGNKEENRAFKRLIAKKLQFMPTKSVSALDVKKLMGMKTNHIVSKSKQSINRFKSQIKNPSAVEVLKFFNENSRILPLKRGAAKMAKRILEKPLVELYNLYLKSHAKVSFAFFCKNRPKSIKTHLSMKLNQALCEVCENLNLKLKALGSMEVGRTPFEVQKNMMCPTDKYFKKKCIEGKCQECGARKLREVIKTEDLEKEVEYKEWSWKDVNRDGGVVKKKALVVRRDTGVEVFEKLIKALETFPQHSFNASWQYEQYLKKKKNLKAGELMGTLDFAENFRCQNQDEAQSAHWNYLQATLHPIVLNYKCSCSATTTEAVIVVSDDLKHDHVAVQCFTEAALKYISDATDSQFHRFIQFTDGCAAQYKSKQPFLDIQRCKSLFGVSTERHFFGSRHGKNPSDGEAAVVKSAAMRAIKCRREIIQNAADLFSFGERKLTKGQNGTECQHYKRKFLFVSKEEILAKRAIVPIAQAIPGTRSIHAIQSWEEGNLLRHRKLSCFCESCERNQDGCCNSSHTDEWQYFQGNSKLKPNEPTPTATLKGPDEDQRDLHPDVSISTSTMENLHSSLFSNDVLQEIGNISLSTSTVEILKTAVSLEEPEASAISEPEASAISEPELMSSTPKKDNPYTVGTYVMVTVYGAKKEQTQFNGIIQNFSDGLFEVKFMERRGNAYIWPEKEDITHVPIYDLVKPLQPPMLVGRGRYVFF
ncbi:hypothetical protein ElyMa_003638800 [Elysia marginata]|uniref:Uncharacterized protein n=1 Tax=Elysia marginata TaxID=1093978 RepID=A0AAV4EW11_9GAST|nr:hypothetical protein ElyMa_003638800 [Elysia marginata]